MSKVWELPLIRHLLFSALFSTKSGLVLGAILAPEGKPRTQPRRTAEPSLGGALKGLKGVGPVESELEFDQ
jgi:hypothetical protein